MKMITSHRGILQIIRRLPSSKYGNPRYMVRVAGYECRTMEDSSEAYSITNFDGKIVTARIGTHYRQQTVFDICLAQKI